MSLCRLQLKKSFGRLLLVFCMLLVGVSITNTSANAASIDSLDITGDQITIIDNENSVLMCQFMTTGSVGSVVYNGYTLANLYNDDTWGGISQVFYLNNPTIGTHNISFSGSINWDYPHPTCYLLTGVNTDNLILSNNSVDFGDHITNISGNISPVNSGSLILGFYTSAQDSANGVNATEVSSHYLNATGSNTYFKSFYNISTSTVGNISLTAAWGGYNQKLKLFELNTNITPPAPSHSPFDYLWSAFDITTEQRFSLGQNINLNVAYDITVEWELNPDVNWYLTPVSSEETGRLQIGVSQLLTSPSGYVNYNQPNYGLINWDFLDQEAEWVITSDLYNMSVVEDELIWSEKPFRIYLVGTNWSGQYVRVPDTSLPLIVNPDTTSTTTIPFIYKFDNVASTTLVNSQICLTSLEGGNNTPGEYCFDVISSSGSSVLEMPIVFSSGTTNFWRFDLVSSSTVLFRGSQFSIEYSNGSVATSTDITTIFGDTAHNLACTTEEWADANEGWLGVNTVLSMCVIKESGWKFLDIIISGFGNMFKWLGNQLLSLFPLNIPSKILECWNNAQTAQLNADLTFLIAYETDKSIVGYMPKEWTGSATDTDLVIFSRQQMEQGSTAVATLFDNFKKFTVFFQWTLFALGLILWSKQVYKDLSNNVHKDKDE